MISEQFAHGRGDMATNHGNQSRQSEDHSIHCPTAAQCTCLHQADCGSVSPHDRKLLREVPICEKTFVCTQEIELSQQKFPPDVRSETTSGFFLSKQVVFPCIPRKLPPMTQPIKLCLLSHKGTNMGAPPGQWGLWWGGVGLFSN